VVYRDFIDISFYHYLRSCHRFSSMSMTRQYHGSMTLPLMMTHLSWYQRMAENKERLTLTFTLSLIIVFLESAG